MYNRKRRSPMTLGEVMMFAAGTLFCLVLITTAMMGGLFARYTATAEGSDSARVAGFDVEVTGLNDNIQCAVTAAKPGEIKLMVVNKSEVAVTYNIGVKIKETAGCGVKWTLDDKTAQKFPAKQKDQESEEVVRVYEKVGDLAAGATSDEHTLFFEPLDWSKITSEVNGPTKQLTQSFTVYVDVVQVD